MPWITFMQIFLLFFFLGEVFRPVWDSIEKTSFILGTKKKPPTQKNFERGIGCEHVLFLVTDVTVNNRIYAANNN